MPVMDGFEATGRIRRLEADRSGAASDSAACHTPIVALTANSLSGDRERCLAAGMDDHVAKPFRRAQLFATVARWVGLPSAEVTNPSGLARTPYAALLRADAQLPGVIDRGALLTHLTIGGRVRPALVAKVIGLFVSETPAILDGLAQGLKRQDRAAVERAVHTLKASAATVGASGLSELARLAERHARTGSLTAVQQQLGEILRHFDLAVAQLQVLRSEFLHSPMDIGAT